MTSSSVSFRLKFTKAVYVSSEVEPDVLRVTIRDPYIFMSTGDRSLTSLDSRRSL